MNLTRYDHIVVNSSGGKDSQAMLDYIVALAAEQGVLDRLIVVHADLGFKGRIEWKGTRDLVEKQCHHYGVELIVVHREKGDLLDQVELRGMWPDNKNRYCTSDQKRDQIAKIINHLPGTLILNCLGFRADESPARAKRQPFSRDMRLTNGKRTVDVWLPIHKWNVSTVWKTIRSSRAPYHYAYDLGMPRLSCAFCIFAPENALLLAGKHNPELLAQYVEVERKIGHDFRNGFKIESIQQKLAAGVEPGPIQNWTM